MVLKLLATAAGMFGAAAYASRSGQLQRACRRILAQSTSAPTIIAPPPPQKVKLALCQLHVTSDKESNLANAFNSIKEAASEGAQLVVLPEMFNCPYSNDSFPVYAEDIDAGKSPTYDMLSQAAATCRVTLVAGSIPERSDGKLYNTCCVFGTNGKLLAKHRKVHLFDIDIPGKMTFKESLTLTAGQSITVVDTPAGRIGVGICYDIRFPELAMLYANRGVQLIVYPGAFNMVTGPQHWELLQRARAVDNQLFVAACSPARDADASYQAWGHSTIVGPFGEILGTAGHEPTIVYADIDYNQIEERRTNMPIGQQKRYDMYTILDKTL